MESRANEMESKGTWRRGTGHTRWRAEHMEMVSRADEMEQSKGRW